ncbi:hypothetical protein ASE25_12785 [Terrabacter sp. Root85]|uniref:hypothetical protein n=1 Tax=Terrabacter sp. Root85 TaxID=1736603 RepID=UPI0006F734AC|nr:hypothetical protein [Terrabacter sp. Root85]KRC88708.1 hypothetical protein ASE25_12785 [Terrabacter sp. Root85]
MRLRRVVEAVPVVAALATALLAAGCTTDGGVRVSPTVGVSAGAATPEVSLTPIDPGPPPVVTVPPPVAGEVARVVVSKQGSGKAFRNVPGVPVAEGRTYTVEVACAAGRATEGSSYAVYDAAPGTWGHGEPLYSRPFACDGAVQRTVHLGLPSGRVQIDVRGLPADAVTAYALIRPE